MLRIESKRHNDCESLLGEEEVAQPVREQPLEEVSVEEALFN
jgi:hypothetical protein